MRRSTLLRAGLAYFGIVFGAGFALGSIRVGLLVPRLGERSAELLEAPLMLGVTVLAARFVVDRFSLPPRAQSRLPVGVLALALLLAAEWTVVVGLRGQTVGDSLAGRDPVAGVVYALLLVAFAAMPGWVRRGAGGGPGARRRDASRAEREGRSHGPG